MALRKRHRDAEVSTDSLNDIMFFLLLFFLILSTMVSPNAIKVNLPSSKNKKAIESRAKPVHLGITKDRQYTVDNVTVTFDQLEVVLANKIGGNTETTVVVHIDKDLTVQDLVDVMQIGDRLKCKMVTATKASNGANK